MQNGMVIIPLRGKKLDVSRKKQSIDSWVLLNRDISMIRVCIFHIELGIMIKQRHDYLKADLFLTRCRNKKWITIY